MKTIFLFVHFVVLADDDVGQVSRRMTELKVASASLARAFLASETRKAREGVCLGLGRWRRSLICCSSSAVRSFRETPKEERQKRGVLSLLHVHNVRLMIQDSSAS